jgi:hypothetical protein
VTSLRVSTTCSDGDAAAAADVRGAAWRAEIGSSAATTPAPARARASQFTEASLLLPLI